jgi:hypothetical protein
LRSYLALGQLGLDCWPCLALRSIREQVHDNGTSRDGLIDIEEVCAGNPAILNSFLPRSAVLSDANDDIETIVAEIEALTVALGAITDESEGVVLEVVLIARININFSVRSQKKVTHKELLPWPVLTLCDRMSVVVYTQSRGESCVP